MKKIRCVVDKVCGVTARVSYDFYIFNKKYKKTVKKRKTIMVDMGGLERTIKKGDELLVVSCRKISKNKSFRFLSTGI